MQLTSFVVNMDQNCNHQRQRRSQPDRYLRRRYSPSVKAAAAATFAIAVLSSTSSLSRTSHNFCVAQSVDSEDIPKTKDELLQTLQEMKHNMNVTDDGIPSAPALAEHNDEEAVDGKAEKIANETHPSVDSPVLESISDDDASIEADSEDDAPQNSDTDETSTGSDGVSSDTGTEKLQHLEDIIKNKAEMVDPLEATGEKFHEQIEEDVGEASNGDNVELDVNSAAQAGDGSSGNSDQEHIDAQEAKEAVSDGDSSSGKIRDETNKKVETKTSSPSDPDESYIDLDDEGNSSFDEPSDVRTDTEEAEGIAYSPIPQNDNGDALAEKLVDDSENTSSGSSGVDTVNNPDETDTNPSPEANEHSSNIDPDKAKEGKNSAEEKPPPKGSLASFFAELSAKEKGGANQANASGGDLAGVRKRNVSGASSFEQRAQLAEEMHVLENIQQQRMGQKTNDLSQLSNPPPEPQKKLEDYPPKEYRGTWGIYSQSHRPADLDLLYLVFQDHIEELSGRTKYEYQEARFPIGINADVENEDELDIEDEYEQMKAKIEKEFPEASIDMQAEPLKNSVNSDFVEGLDDIDKFFEGVDPPDELDIGASGSSMQEVLMGKGREILFKRIGLGIGLVRSGLSSLWMRLARLFHRFKNDDGEIMVTKEQLKDMTMGLWRETGALYQRIVAFVDELIDGEDLDGEDLVDIDAEFERLGLRDASFASTGSMKPPLLNDVKD